MTKILGEVKIVEYFVCNFHFVLCTGLLRVRTRAVQRNGWRGSKITTALKDVEVTKTLYYFSLFPKHYLAQWLEVNEL